MPIGNTPDSHVLTDRTDIACTKREQLGRWDEKPLIHAMVLLQSNIFIGFAQLRETL